MGSVYAVNTMIMKTFLVAVDFSDAANLVVEKAGGLAQQLSARIVLLHVFEPKPAYVPMGETAGVVIGAAWPLTTPQGPSGPRGALGFSRR